MSRLPIPANIEVEMKQYRMGIKWSVPKSYINWMEQIARADLVEFAKANGLTVHNAYLASDGWPDGMQMLTAVVEDREGNLIKIRWHDQQTWFQRMPSGGWALMSDVRTAKAA